MGNVEKVTNPYLTVHLTLTLVHLTLTLQFTLPLSLPYSSPYPYLTFRLKSEQIIPLVLEDGREVLGMDCDSQSQNHKLPFPPRGRCK